MPRPCTTFACHERSSGLMRTPRSALIVVFVVAAEVVAAVVAVVVRGCGLVGELERRSHKNLRCRRQFLQLYERT